MSNLLHMVCPSCGSVNRIPSDRLVDSPRCGRCKTTLTDAVVSEVDADGFEKIVRRSDIPLLVDFWAPWCGPCKMMAPMFQAAAVELAPHVQLIKLNTEENQQLASKLGIRSIPTLALYKGGSEVARTAGAMDTSNLVAWSRQHLAL